MFKIATWNVNSVRVRLPQLLDWLAVNKPDIIALQETKVTDDLFPSVEIEANGYEVIFAGQKTYNGVAILSKQKAKDIITDLPNLDDPQRRVLGATYQDIRILNLYVPNGTSLESDKYQYKLNWLKHLHNYVQTAIKQHEKLIILGDFNIAPTDDDVYDPKVWVNRIIVSPKERAALQDLLDLGLRDCFRLFEQDGFSWWDYRHGGFQRNRGLRIDLILASTGLNCTTCTIDTTLRGLERPSDHAPVVAIFENF
ncbi:exodeoxyribonuclease III [Candidatus Halobeggiatoa sp. HSG11]|nr:exodeoxyribonuclease III [Candidatus Halobeggiatoa sp. HSG11]